ncbi:MAG: EAL domain-containing protein [Erysipelotrichaceae bacterium]
MRTWNYLYHDDIKLQNFLHMVQVPTQEALFIRVHTSIHTREQAVTLAKHLRTLFPNAIILGTSACSIIYQGTIQDDTCLISIHQFEHTNIALHAFPLGTQTTTSLAKDVCHHCCNANTQVMFSFFSDHYPKAYEFIEAFNQLQNHIRIIGGLAGETQATGPEGYVFTPELGAPSDTLLVATLSSTTLNVWSSAFIGHEAIGEEHTITKATGLYIDEVDGIPATRWFKDLLGVTSFEENLDWDINVPTDILLRFPLVLSHHHGASRFVQYQKYQDRIKQYFCELSAGERFRIGYLSPYTTVNLCQAICDELVHQPIETMMVYSCIFRKLYLNRSAEWELSPFSATNVCGAFLHGEIANINGTNEYLNGGCSLMTLAERDVYLPIDRSSFERLAILEDDSKELLHYVLKKQNETIFYKNKILMEQLLDRQAAVTAKTFTNEHTGFPNFRKYSIDKQELGYNKLCLMKMEQADLFETILGKADFMTLCTRNVSQVFHHLSQEQRYSHIHIYQYQDAHLILAANDEVDDANFTSACQELFQHFSLVAYKDEITIINQFGLVMHVPKLLEKARLLLLERGLHERFVIYQETMELESSVDETLAMIGIINQAMKKDGIVPYIQPIYDNKALRITKYEVLMRLADLQGNVIYPGKFLPIAHKYRLYNQMMLVLLQQIFDNYALLGVTLSINLTASDIISPLMQDLIFSFLEKGQYRSHFIFEVVETESFDNFEALQDFALRIRSFGCEIAIDDFGAGYSSLYRIALLQPDYIKIDGTIILDVIHNPAKQAILQTVLFLANQLEVKLIAEFVETAAIQSYLQALGVDFSQGYLFGKPIPATQLFHGKAK